MVFKLGLRSDDPRLAFKHKVCQSFDLEAVAPLAGADLVDLSDFDYIEKGFVHEIVQKSPILVSPALLAKLPLDGIEASKIFVSLPFREWALVPRMRTMKNENACGDLTSLRMTWTTPKKLASNEAFFLHHTLAGFIDAAEYIADAKLESLYVEKVPGRNNLFALAMLEREIAVEIEANEALPNSMPVSHFIKANFTDGILTNMPLVGHFNEEGSIVATDDKLERLVIENESWDGGDEIENAYWRMILSISEGAYAPGLGNIQNILYAIDKAVETSRPITIGVDK